MTFDELAEKWKQYYDGRGYINVYVNNDIEMSFTDKGLVWVNGEGYCSVQIQIAHDRTPDEMDKLITILTRRSNQYAN